MPGLARDPDNDQLFCPSAAYVILVIPTVNPPSYCQLPSLPLPVTDPRAQDTFYAATFLVRGEYWKVSDCLHYN